MKQTIEYEYFDNSSHFLIGCVQLKKDFFFPILVRLSFLISTYVERKAGSYTTTGLSFCQNQLRSTITPIKIFKFLNQCFAQLQCGKSVSNS